MADLQTEDVPAARERAQREGTLLIPTEQIAPNSDQPRRIFDQTALSELADSIRTRGVIQPLIVRRHPQDANIYQIVAGERRWRASQIAQVHELPVIIRDFSDAECSKSRSSKTPARRSECDRRGRVLSPTDDSLRAYAREIGRSARQSRSHIANLLRLNLPDQVQDWVREENPLCWPRPRVATAENPTVIARRIIDKGLCRCALCFNADARKIDQAREAAQ